MTRRDPTRTETLAVRRAMAMARMALTATAASLTLVATTLALTTPARGANDGEPFYADGFYISVGVGGALVGGERGVQMDNTLLPKLNGSPICSGNAGPTNPYMWAEPGSGSPAAVNDPSYCTFASSLEQFDEVVRTDGGTGLGVELRLGYNIKGYAGLELSFAGNGSLDLAEGSAYLLGQVRLHPIQFFIPFEDRIWDINLVGGAGYILSGYQPDQAIQGNDDGKGWEGIVYSVGLGVGIAPVEWMSIDLDLRLLIPRYVNWIVSWSDDIRSLPVETPSTVIFAPTVQLTFRVPDSGA